MNMYVYVKNPTQAIIHVHVVYPNWHVLCVHLQASLAPLANPQLARINKLYNLLSNSSSSDYLKWGEEPILEGLTPTLDLNLFREAQERTRGGIGMFIMFINYHCQSGIDVY